MSETVGSGRTRTGDTSIVSRNENLYFADYIPSQDDELIGIASADLIPLDDASAGVAESTITETVFDTTSRPDAARILLTNSTGDFLVLRAVFIRGYPVIRKPAFIHDSFTNYADIALNGEAGMSFGGDDVVVADQLNKIAEHKWKEHGTARHAYSFSLPGTWIWLRPGGRYHLQVGAAGKAEYVDSFVTCYSVRTTIGREISTQVVMYETAEAFKFDSNAVTRFVATGRTSNLYKGAVIRIGTRYSLSNVDVRCDGVADEVEINAAILVLSTAAGGGTVHLTGGTYITAAAIEMKSNVILEGEGAITSIEKNCNDYGVECVGGSGTEIIGAGLRNLKVTRNAADTNDKHLSYMTYADNLLIENLALDDAYSDGAYFSYCDALSIKNISITDFGTIATGTSIGIDLRVGGSGTINGVYIDNHSSTRDCTMYGMYIGSQYTIAEIYIQNLSCSNTLYGVLSNAAINCSNIFVLNCDRTTAGSIDGISLASANCRLSGVTINDVDNTHTAANSIGLHLGAAASACIIGDIHSTGCSGTGVQIDAGATRDIIVGRSTGNGTNLTDNGTNTNKAAFDAT